MTANDKRAFERQIEKVVAQFDGLDASAKREVLLRQHNELAGQVDASEV